MGVYKVTAKQIYYIEADSSEEAITHFIDEDDHVCIRLIKVTDVVLVEENE